MSLSRASALSLCLCILPAFGFAAGSAQAYEGTQSEQEACTGDVFSLCSSFIPDEKPIVACLMSKRPQLSAACSQVLFPDPKPRRQRARTAQD